MYTIENYLSLLYISLLVFVNFDCLFTAFIIFSKYISIVFFEYAAGVCLGMQCAVIEFARNVLGMKGANSTEADPSTPHPVVSLLRFFFDPMNSLSTIVDSLPKQEF